MIYFRAPRASRQHESGVGSRSRKLPKPLIPSNHGGAQLRRGDRREKLALERENRFVVLERAAVDEEDVFAALAERGDLRRLKVHLPACEHFRDGEKESDAVRADDVEDGCPTRFVRRNVDDRARREMLRAARKARLRHGRQGGVRDESRRETRFEPPEVGGFRKAAVGIRHEEGVERVAARRRVDPGVDDREAGLAEKGDGAVPALPVTDTIKTAVKTPEGALKIEKTVDRSALWRVQTPQAFPFKDILDAHEKAKGRELTDDADLGRPDPRRRTLFSKTARHPNRNRI